MAWLETQTSYDGPLSQSPVQSKALTLQLREGWERLRRLQEKSLKLSRGRFMRSRARNPVCLHNRKVPSADGEAEIWLRSFMKGLH